MEKKIRIVITGGHLTPALAVIDKLRSVHPDWEMIFIGRTQEQEEIKKRNLRFYAITTGKLQTFTSLLKFPIGFVQSCWYLLRCFPTVVITFGGYISFPVAMCAWLLGIPIVIHEQTHTLGRANRFLLPFVSYCLLSYENTKFAPNTSFVTGIPFRKEMLHPPKAFSFSAPSGLPIIYITGGSTGAVSMNELLFPIIHSLVENAVVVHQTGPHSIEKAKEVKQTLPEKYRERYIPISYIEGIDIGWIMHHMSIIVGRSGGNTVAETALVHKPAVFIPLPWSGQHEQEQNARWYKKIGTAYVANQEKDTGEVIRKKIAFLLQQKTKKITAKGIQDTAAKNIIKYIELLV